MRCNSPTGAALTRALTAAAALALAFAAAPASASAAAPSFDQKDLFEAETGGYAHYRIPGLVVTKNGTVLAYCEARKAVRSDWGAIDILMTRSTDGGRTWSPPRKVADPPEGVEK